MTVNIRLIAAALISVPMLAGCDAPKEPHPAGLACEAYYDALLERRYDHFLDATVGGRELRPEWREERIANLKMTLRNIDNSHGGIVSTKVDSVGKPDTVDGTERIGVFLHLYFRDKTDETVIVPMQKHGDDWLMR